MFIIFGLHRKQHPLSTKADNCLYCHIPTPHSYIAVKRAFHVFWIPLVPLGAKLVQKCHNCGNHWDITDAPMDLSFFAYFGLVAALLVSVIITAGTGICYFSGLLGVSVIAVSTIYLFKVPGAYSPFRQDSGEMPVRPPPGAVPYPGVAALPPQPAAQDLYANDFAARAEGGQPAFYPQGYAAEVNCNKCLRKYQVPSGQPVAICPYCGATKASGQ